MKKLSFLLVAGAMISLAACNNAKDTAAADAAKADSIKAAMMTDSLAKVAEPTAAAAADTSHKDAAPAKMEETKK